VPLPKVWNDYDRLDAADLNADMAYLDKLELAYVTATANVAIPGLTEAAATAILTSPAIALDGVTPIEIECQLPGLITPTAGGAPVLVYLFMDGNSLGRLAAIQTPSAGTFLVPLHVRYRMTPANGSHVFSIRASVSAGSGTVQAGPGGAGQIMPATLRIRET
jgi:hypothetical protein